MFSFHHRCSPIRGIVGLFVSGLLLGTLPAEHEGRWPQFRGADARGVAADSDRLPDQWSTTQNVVWSEPIEGRGWSSPIVWGDRVFLTTVANDGETEPVKKGLYFGGNRSEPPKSNHRWKAICLSLSTGEKLWDRTLHEGVPPTSMHLKNSYASETPVTDGKQLYCYFGNVGLFCLTMDGELIWTHEVEPHKTRFDWGTASSPVVYEDRLIFVNDNEENSYLIALDTQTGNPIWRVERDEKSNWATPYVWQHEQRTEIVTPGTGKIRSYDLNGNLLYELGGCSSITIANPYAENGLLYVTSGYVLDKKKPIFAIRPGASGDISLGADQTSNEFIAWCQLQAAPYNPSTLLYEGLIYVLYDRGFFACYDALTGEKIYGKQRIPNGRAFTASPWAYNGKIFCLNEDGKTFVIKAGPEFEILRTNELEEGELCMATPAIANDRLLIRTADRLYCLQQQE
ncbi:MAG: PQQ-binding-like beta-propeller repeat protein [Pirellulaceae bacterium]|nr:PQQ-binding-like beta-propeller repeat protein [Pirellulaceae bacterium]